MTKRIPKPTTETKLERTVRVWLNNAGLNYDNGWMGAYKDLEYGGCQSGLVGPLIYYTDTVRFYKRYRTEISDLLSECQRDLDSSPLAMFGDKWDIEDPLALHTQNQNLLAWYGFEETARRIAEANGYK